MKKIYKSKNDYKISGVCGGISTYLGINSVIIRIFFIIFLLTTNIAAIIAYFVMSSIIPMESDIIDY